MHASPTRLSGLYLIIHFLFFQVCLKKLGFSSKLTIWVGHRNLRCPTRNLYRDLRIKTPNRQYELDTVTYGVQPEIFIGRSGSADQNSKPTIWVGHRKLRCPTRNLYWDLRIKTPNRQYALDTVTYGVQLKFRNLDENPNFVKHTWKNRK